MGGRAYAALAERSRAAAGACSAAVFAELSQKFQPMVDALNEVSETSYRHSDQDMLRLYEIWLKTGSARCYRFSSASGWSRPRRRRERVRALKTFMLLSRLQELIGGIYDVSVATTSTTSW